MKTLWTFWKPWMTAGLAAAAITAAAATDILFRTDSSLADLLYQAPRVTDGEVLVIGIDAKALDDLGPFQSWGRDILAMAVEELNADPAHQPAVIGLDILFTGESDPEADAYLAEVCGAYDNVVTASVANFTEELVINEDGTFFMDDYAIESVDDPYPELKEATRQGHINAMYDVDGILRHSILYMDLADGERLPSFSWQIYQTYMERMGMTANEEPPTDARHRWYLPYSMMPGGYYEGYSVSDLIAGEVPWDVFEDRIVLIGPYTAGLSDYARTAMDHAQLMYGVEYQANAIDALIDGIYKTEASDFWQYLLLFLITFSCFLWFRGMNIYLMTGIWLAGTVGYVAGARWMYEQGMVLHVIWIPFSVSLIFIYYVASNYLHAAMDKRKVTTMFKRYVAPEIVNEILKEGTDALQLGGKMTEIAVLFVDIRGFTTMSEQLNPQEVVEIVNRYLTLTSRCVMQNQGTLDKFVGDCTMAIWGAPLPQEDYIYKAAKAALDMVNGARPISEELYQRFGKRLAFGVGIHCGPAVVGNIGAPDRMDFTAIGDTVNTASRLESNAPGGTVYISREVMEALKGRVIATPLDHTLKVKGKAEALEVYCLEGLIEE